MFLGTQKPYINAKDGNVGSVCAKQVFVKKKCTQVIMFLDIQLMLLYML